MKVHVWDYESSLRKQPLAPRRKTVAQILRAAYRLYSRDAHTRLAVKRCLRK